MLGLLSCSVSLSRAIVLELQPNTALFSCYRDHLRQVSSLLTWRRFRRISGSLSLISRNDAVLQIVLAIQQQKISAGTHRRDEEMRLALSCACMLSARRFSDSHFQVSCDPSSIWSGTQADLWHYLLIEARHVEDWRLAQQLLRSNFL